MFTTLAFSIMLVGAIPAPEWRLPTNGDTDTVWLVAPGYCRQRLPCVPDRLLGAYNYATKEYRVYRDVLNKWGPPTAIPPDAPPLPLRPAQPPRKPDARPLTGVRNDKVYQLNPPSSGTFTADEIAAMLSDDTALPFLTLICEAGEARRHLDTLPTPLKAGSRLKVMPPGYWAAKKFGVPAGSSGIFYQAADGTVIARQSPFVDPQRFLDTINPPETPEPPVMPISPPDVDHSDSWVLLGLGVSILVFMLLRSR